MATYAPINMPPPESGQEIAEQIRNSILGPLQQGSEYQSLLGQQPGLNLGPDIPKLIMGLARAIGLADPSGMIGGPAGLVYKTSASTSPQLLKILDTIKKVGATAEEISPRMKAVTQHMPVNLLQPWKSRPGSVAEYLSPSPLREFGTANLYRPDPTAILHEAAGHGLQALDPATKELAHELYLNSPVGTESILTKLGVPSNLLREEFGARLIENVLSKKVAEKLGMALPSGPIPFAPEMEERMWQFLQETPSKGVKSSKTLSEVLNKTKAPRTSKLLEDTYRDMVTWDAQQHPLRSRIEKDPFARVKFYNEMQRKIKTLPDGYNKNKATEFINLVKDPKDPKSVPSLELAAQEIHEAIGRQSKTYETLLSAEFGPEDAQKIIKKNWNTVLNETEEGPIKFEKNILQSERGSFSNEEIRKDIEEAIGRDISKKVRGKTVPRKGGGMIVNREEKLSDYLNEYPTKGEGWQLIRE